MNSLIVRLGAFASLLALSISAQAQSSGVSYTFVDVSYQNLSGDLDGDGVRAEGSLGISNYFHAFSNFESSSLDDTVTDDGMGTITTTENGDWSTLGIGFGVHSPLTSGVSRGYTSVTDRFSFFLDGQFLISETDTPLGDINGWALDTGFRAVNSSRLEFIGKIGYENFEKIDGELTLEGRLLFHIIDNLQLQGGVDWNDRETRWFLGGRYNFGGWQIFN
jgi:hypothetical protein